MNTHKPDPRKLISLDGMEPIPTPQTACVCNSETNTTCMLHFNLDGFILAEALKEEDK